MKEKNRQQITHDSKVIAQRTNDFIPLDMKESNTLKGDVLNLWTCVKAIMQIMMHLVFKFISHTVLYLCTFLADFAKSLVQVASYTLLALKFSGYIISSILVKTAVNIVDVFLFLPRKLGFILQHYSKLLFPQVSSYYSPKVSELLANNHSKVVPSVPEWMLSDYSGKIMTQPLMVMDQNYISTGNDEIENLESFSRVTDEKHNAKVYKYESTYFVCFKKVQYIDVSEKQAFMIGSKGNQENRYLFSTFKDLGDLIRVWCEHHRGNYLVDQWVKDCEKRKIDTTHSRLSLEDIANLDSCNITLEKGKLLVLSKERDNKTNAYSDCVNITQEDQLFVDSTIHSEAWKSIIHLQSKLTDASIGRGRRPYIQKTIDNVLNKIYIFTNVSASKLSDAINDITNLLEIKNNLKLKK